MNAKLWILVLSAAALVAGAILLISRPPAVVSVFNPDPPGPEFTIIMIRSGCHADYACVGTLRPGATATAIGRDSAGAWLLLESPRGWVAAHLIEIHGDVDLLPISNEVIVVEAPVPGSPVKVANPKLGIGDFTAEVLAMPAPGSEIVGGLGPGMTALAIGRDTVGTWLLLDQPHGWVLGSVLEVSGDVNALPIKSGGVPLQ